MITISVNKIQDLISKNDLDQATKMINQLSDQKEIIMGLVLKSRISEKLGKLDDALQLSQSAINNATSQEYTSILIDAHLVHANNLMRQGKLIDAQYHVEVARDRYLYQVKDIDQKNQITIKARIYLSLGLLNEMKGHLQEALSYYNEILIIEGQLDNQYLLAHTYNNLGEIYRLSGELTIAKRYYQQSLDLRQEIAALRGIAVCHVNLGIVEDRLSNVKSAIKHFRIAYSMFTDQSNDLDIAEALYHYILALLDTNKNNSDEIEDLIQQLNLLNIQNSNPRISLFSRIVQAIYLKKKGRSKYFVKSQMILENIREEDMIDFEYYVFAMLNLAELYYIEYRMIQNDEIYSDLTNLINELYQIAQEQRSYSLLVQILMIQAKLSFYENDLNKSFLLMDQAELIGKEHNLSRLTEEVNREKSQLQEELRSIDDVLQQNQQIASRLKFSELTSYLKDAVKFFK